MPEHHIVALSGGKDSTAMALRLREVEPRQYTYLCTPTGDDPAELIDDWRWLSAELGAENVKFMDPRTTLRQLIRDIDMLPNHRARWCTRILKIEPCLEYLESLEGDATLYVGLRADEPERKGGVYGDTAQRYPMREWGWGLTEVVDYLQAKGVSIPKRTDCNRCFHQRLGEWWNLWKYTPEMYQTAVDDEEYVSEKRGKRVTFRSEQRDSWPAGLGALREEFEAGKVPPGSDNQGDMFDPRCRVCSM